VLPVLSVFNYISCHGHAGINSHLHAIYTKLQNKQILILDNLTFLCGGLHEEFVHLKIYFMCLESEKIKLKNSYGTSMFKLLHSHEFSITIPESETLILDYE